MIDNENGYIYDVQEGYTKCTLNIEYKMCSVEKAHTCYDDVTPPQLVFYHINVQHPFMPV